MNSLVKQKAIKQRDTHFLLAHRHRFPYPLPMTRPRSTLVSLADTVLVKKSHKPCFAAFDCQ